MTNYDNNMANLDATTDDEAMNIKPLIETTYEPLGLTFKVQDTANLFLPHHIRTTTISPSGNLKLSFKGFDKYATKDNTHEISAFIAEQRLSEYDEAKIIDTCRIEMLKGNAIVFGEVDFVDATTNQIVGFCYGPVFYTVKPSNDTQELLPITDISNYVQHQFDTALVDADQPAQKQFVTQDDIDAQNKAKRTKVNNYLNKKVVAALAGVGLIAPIAFATVYNFNKPSNDAKEQPSTIASSKTPAETLKSVNKEPVMLVNEKGDTIKKDVDDMANLQVATTEDYLKKMGVDVNKKSDLSCLE